MADVFQRRHFVELAAIISAIDDLATRRAVTAHFVERIIVEHPRFNPVLFYDLIPGVSPPFTVEPAAPDKPASGRLRKGSPEYYAAVERMRVEEITFAQGLKRKRRKASNDSADDLI